MKNLYKILSISILTIVVFAGTNSVYAKEPVKTTIKKEDGTAKLVEKSNKEIDQRIESLNKLTARVNEMRRLTDAQKSGIITQIQGLVTSLTTLKTKIAIDMTASSTDQSVLKEDMESITKSYRIYALIMPQIHIIATVDRIATLGSSLTTVGTKLQTRIDLATTTDTTVLKATLVSYTTHIANANTQAQAALNLVLPLVPDNGDKAVQDKNMAALKEARANIKKAMEEIALARKDAETIIKALSPKSAKTVKSIEKSTTKTPKK